MGAPEAGDAVVRAAVGRGDDEARDAGPDAEAGAASRWTAGAPTVGEPAADAPAPGVDARPTGEAGPPGRGPAAARPGGRASEGAVPAAGEPGSVAPGAGEVMGIPDAGPACAEGSLTGDRSAAGVSVVSRWTTGAPGPAEPAA
ncbi:hypothetical protein ACGFWD_21600 [Streptomyces sp. NPDC048448]|uniref:hypothetical protein n=1 Tax=unclassified Streptomyces TaxID=2593676 RepID=UPI003432C5F6